jgi:hypothetical protein
MKNGGKKLIMEVTKGGTKNGRKTSKMEGSKEERRLGCMNAHGSLTSLCSH